MKKNISWSLIICILCALLPNCAFAADNTENTYVVFEETPQISGLSIDSESLTYGTVNEESAVVLNGSGKSIGFDINDDIAYEISDGSVFDIEVEYYCKGDGFFLIGYDAEDRQLRYEEPVITSASAYKKTAVFSIDDAYFANRANSKYDFIITVQAPYYYKTEITQSDIYIRKVSVKKHTAQNAVTQRVRTENVGNVFSWYENEKTVYSELTNTTNENQNAEISFRAVNSDGEEIWNRKENVTLSPHEVRETSFNIDTNRCGLYTLKSAVKVNQKEIGTKSGQLKFAIVKTDPNGIKNKSYYFASHPEHYTANMEAAFDIIGKSNAYGIRTEFGWSKVETMMGDGADTFEYKKTDKNIHDKMKSYNLHLFPIFAFSSAGYMKTANDKFLPETDKQLTRWSQAMEFIAKNTVGLADCIEIWNEPNIRAFNGGDGGASYDIYTPASGYAKAAIAACQAAKRGNPEIKTGIMSLISIGAEETKAFFDEALEAGAAEYCDAITLHPYSALSADDAKTAELEKEYIQQAKEKTGRELPVWNTEYGYSTSDPVSNTEDKQANNLVRSALYFSGEKSAEINIGYNFEQKGIVKSNREGNFGIVSPGFSESEDRSGKCFVPRKAYVDITAMNYFLAESEADGNGNYAEADNDYIYRFTSNKFGGSVAALWTSGEAHSVTLQLGTNSITKSDECGNTEEVRSNDGIYTFELSERPIYLAGDIEKPETARAERKYTFLNENFNGYSGVCRAEVSNDNFDIPSGWVQADISSIDVNHKYTDYWSPAVFALAENGHGTIHSENRAENDYALRMTGNNQKQWSSTIVKYFTNSAATGDFTLEFDVKHNNGGWGIGLINYDNYDAAYTWGAYGSDVWPTSEYIAGRSKIPSDNLSQRIYKSKVIGIPNVKRADSPVSVQTELCASKTFDWGDSGMERINEKLQISPNIWTHVKVDFNTKSYVHNIEITPEDGESVTAQWTDSIKGRFEKGVMGIVLSQWFNKESPSDEVCFDNIEVYQNGLRYAESDFNGYNGGGNGWYRISNQLTRKSLTAFSRNDSNLSVSAGVSGEDGDNAISFKAVSDGIQDNLFIKPFYKPSFGKKPTAVEFDLKTSSAETGWQLHRINQSQLFALKGFNYTGALEQNTKTAANGGTEFVYAEGKNKRNLQANNAVLGKLAGEDTLRFSDSRGGILNLSLPSGYAYVQGRTAENISMKGSDEKWYHYKIVINPVSESRTDYTVYVNPVGQSGKVTEESFSTSENSIAYPIVGIGFTATGNGEVSMDNLKVYEAENSAGRHYPENHNCENAKITGITAEYTDGSSEELTDGSVIGNTVKRFAIHFSESAAMRDGKVTQPLNACMTSTAADTAEPSLWNDESRQYFNVYDTVGKAISLKRLYANTDKIGGIVTDKYLSEDGCTYYIELADCMLEKNKDYILDIAPNITFENSGYSELAEGKQLRFAVTGENAPSIGSVVLERKNGDEWEIADSVEKLSDGDVLRISVKGCNPCDEPKKLSVITAQYKNSALNSFDVWDLECDGCGMIDAQREFVFNKKDGTDMIRCFVWDFEIMKPYFEKTEI